MKVTRVKEFADDTTMTLRIIEGETTEGTIVTERHAVDNDPKSETYMQEYTHVTLESPSIEDQAIRSLEELQLEVEGETEFDI